MILIKNKSVQLVESVDPGWLLRVQHVVTPHSGVTCTSCHAHLQGPTATTESVFVRGSSLEQTVSITLDYSEYIVHLSFAEPQCSSYVPPFGSITL